MRSGRVGRRGRLIAHVKGSLAADNNAPKRIIGPALHGKVEDKPLRVDAVEAFGSDATT